MGCAPAAREPVVAEGAWAGTSRHRRFRSGSGAPLLAPEGAQRELACGGRYHPRLCVWSVVDDRAAQHLALQDDRRGGHARRSAVGLRGEGSPLQVRRLRLSGGIATATRSERSGRAHRPRPGESPLRVAEEPWSARSRIRGQDSRQRFGTGLARGGVAEGRTLPDGSGNSVPQRYGSASYLCDVRRSSGSWDCPVGRPAAPRTSFRQRLPPPSCVHRNRGRWDYNWNRPSAAVAKCLSGAISQAWLFARGPEPRRDIEARRFSSGGKIDEPRSGFTAWYAALRGDDPRRVISYDFKRTK
jgi:hypothetical protein